MPEVFNTQRQAAMADEILRIDNSKNNEKMVQNIKDGVGSAAASGRAMKERFNAQKAQFDAYLNETDLPQVLLTLRRIYIANATLLITAVTTALFKDVTMFLHSPFDAISAIYVFVFGFIILAFDLQIDKFNAYLIINEYLSFITTLPGRALFIVMSGGMCYPLGTLGWVTAIFSLLNGILLMYVTFKHPILKDNPTEAYAAEGGVAAN